MTARIDEDAATPAEAAKLLEQLIDAPSAYRRAIVFAKIVTQLGRPTAAVWDVPCRTIMPLSRFYEHVRENALRGVKGLSTVKHAGVVWATEHDVEVFASRHNVRRLPTVAQMWDRATTSLRRCGTSYGARHGECAVWLNADTLCSRPAGHWPDTRHRGYDPSGSGRWIEYTEENGEAAEVARGGGW